MQVAPICGRNLLAPKERLRERAIYNDSAPADHHGRHRGWGEVRPSESTGPSWLETGPTPPEGRGRSLQRLGDGRGVLAALRRLGTLADRHRRPGAGRKAQASGIPWDDPSGVRLRSWLGVSEQEFYDPERFALLPMDFFYPGKGDHGDLRPRRDFAATWHPRFLAELADVGLTVLVGSYAQRHYLAGSRKSNLTETVRCFEEYLPDYLPIVHPSPLNFRWQTKNPWFGATLLPRLRMIVKSVLNDD